MPQPVAAGAVAPVVTTIPLTISGVGAKFSLTDVTANVNISNQDLANISIQLVDPGGTTITLLRNANTETAASSGTPAVITTTTTTSTTQGAAEPNAGSMNATFNDDAASSIFGTTGGAAATGNFTVDGNSPTNKLSVVFGGQNASQVNGQWKLVITNYVAGSSGSVNAFGLTINGVNLGTERNVVTLNANGNIRGSTNAAFFSDDTSMLAVPNRGIDPAPVIVSDNTLGPDSPYEGRIYLAYTDRYNTTQVPGNPADNTDIFLLVSDNGGTTWTNPSTGSTATTTSGAEQVNDDNAQTDGFSESDRPQFEPNLAVDPASGMLAISFFDARNDAARDRVATYVGTSIDGGASFSAETYVNLPQQAVDEATNAVVTLGPIPDNESAAGGIGDGTFDYGDHQALIFYGGNLMPVWASNQNGRTATSNAPMLLQITIAHATVAVGPRVVSVTEGPVGTTYGPVADSLNPDPSTATGPSFGKFIVNFDRPVDVNSFLARDVQVLSDGTTDAKVNYTGGFTITAENASGGFATEFLVSLNTPQTAVGAYTIAVAPTVATDIRTDVQYYNKTTLITSESMDQDTKPADAGLATNVYPTSNLAGDAPDVTLPVIVPGPHVIGSSVTGGTGADNEVLNGTVSAIDVTFDRNMNPATITPASVLRVMGPAGQIAGPFTVSEVNPTTFQVGFPTHRTSTARTPSRSRRRSRTPWATRLDTNLNAGLYAAQGTDPYGTDSPVSFGATLPAGARRSPTRRRRSRTPCSCRSASPTRSWCRGSRSTSR